MGTEQILEEKTYYEKQLEKFNRLSTIAEKKAFIKAIDFEHLIEKDNDAEIIKELKIINDFPFKDIIDKKSKIFSRRGQIESFYEEQQFYYDTSKIFWLWDIENFKWVKSDEVDFLNAIQQTLGVDTIDSKTRTELVEGFKQIGRRYKPEPAKKSWIQFKDKIYDVLSGEVLEASPKYFITNPIPYKVGESEETPTIDRLFTEWVGEDKQRLYELIAYILSTNQFMQRIFALCGGGSNGKGTFMKLCLKFIGQDNSVSSEIKNLSENKFEPAVLFKKLLCIMGEVSYDDLKNTNQLKKLAGEDLISYEFKGKTPFTDENTATCTCLTNSLPITPDKSVGFYRKWNIIDFPNQFTGVKHNLISEIPEQEFENLALKSLKILKQLYETNSFTNEGDFEERIRRYEERSNPVLKFVDDCCTEDAGENLGLRDFANRCNEYLKLKHLRILTAKQIGKILRDEGFSVGNRKIDGIAAVVILNLKFNDYQNYQNYHKPILVSHKGLNKDLDSYDSYNSFSDKERQEYSNLPPEEKKIIQDQKFTEEQIKLFLKGRVEQ